MPDNNTATQWKLGLHVRAGQHLLWDEQTRSGERKVWLRSQNFDGAWRQWDGDFDLQSVPAQWGEVTLDWSAQLRHERQNWLRERTDESKRTGHIVLRGAGQTLAAAPLDYNPHLRLIESRIEALPASGGGKNCRLTLIFKRDGCSLTRELLPTSGTLELRSKNGKFVKLAGLYEAKTGQRKADWREFRVEEYLGPPWNLVAHSAHWTLSHGHYWQLQGSLPLADAKGRALLGTKNY